MLTMLLHKIKLKYMLRNKKKSKHRKLTQNFVPRYHKAHLTRRLILDTSADSEMEENMVEWLRVSTIYTSQHQVSSVWILFHPALETLTLSRSGPLERIGDSKQSLVTAINSLEVALLPFIQ